MKYKKIISLLFSSALIASSEVTSIADALSEAEVNGNVRYYYIQTDKDFDTANDTSANSNSVGGQLGLTTASFYGFSSGITFMTTNPFLLGSTVDTSTIGKYNGALGIPADKGFSILGESYLAYSHSDFSASIGRKVIKTPLIHAKDVRMLPSAVEGAFSDFKIDDKVKIEVAYIDKFKQRTSKRFVNIIEHSLGADTQEITGSTSGAIYMLGIDYKTDIFSFKAYDYYAKDFMNSLYLDAHYSFNISDTNLVFKGQYIHQNSDGNADDNLAKVGSLTGAKKIESNALALSLTAKIKNSKVTLAYSNVFKDESKHDSLVLPWDGTPLYTNMITSNNLFQSIYGSALKSDSVYIGGAKGLKIVYNYSFDSFGLNGLSSTLAYLNTSNSRFNKDQHDYNAVLSYKYDKKLSLALKGIWVQNNSEATADGTISQLKLLTQYRVIANYKF